jgi:hypothetical protein
MVLVHDQLIRLFLGCGETEHHDREHVVEKADPCPPDCQEAMTGEDAWVPISPSRIYSLTT